MNSHCPETGPETCSYTYSTLASWPVAWRWVILLVLSLALAFGFAWLRLPAALLLGPMIAAIFMAGRGAAVPIARVLFLAAQGIVGVMIAGSLPFSCLGELAHDWPVFLAGTLSTLVAASFLGWLMARSGILPGTTAIWGSSPGAATAMTLISEDYGADMRLVAFMQYLRVVACTVGATLVARFLGGSTGTGHVPVWLPDLALWYQSLGTVVLAVAGVLVGVVFRIPGGPLLIPMTMGMIASLAFKMNLILPMPLLAASYGLIGWGIGLRFSPEVIAHAKHVFPRVALSILALLAICGGFAVLLVVFADIDPLTAFLSTSPGGADSIAIIATSTSGVNVPFVMSMQVARFLLVVVAGPVCARLLSSGR